MSPAADTRVKAIVAVGEDWAIGRGGEVPWRVPEDMRFFKRTTLGNVVVMGRSTYESLREPLAGRTNVVLSRTHPEGVDEDGVVWTADRRRAVQEAEARGCDLFVAGGAAVYATYADLLDEWVVTRIPETVEDADTFLDRSLLDGWSVVEREDLAPGVTVEHYRRDGSRPPLSPSRTLSDG